MVEENQIKFIILLLVINNIIIQWSNDRLSEETITLPYAYSNTLYHLIIPGAANVNDIWRYYIDSKTVSSFKMQSTYRTCTSELGWLAIGY